jgi:hypothetical protein
MKGSKLTRKLLLQNLGDLDGSFKWDTKNLGPDFALSPATGFIRAGADMEIIVIFTPSKEGSGIRRDDVVCMVVGEWPDLVVGGGVDKSSGSPQKDIGKSNVKSGIMAGYADEKSGEGLVRLKASFVGSCLAQKPVGDAVIFTCPVREKITKEIACTLPAPLQSNRKAGVPLVVNVSIAGDYFSGPLLVEVIYTYNFSYSFLIETVFFFNRSQHRVLS